MEFWRLGVGGAHGSGFNRLSGSGPGKEVTQGGGITGITAFLCFTFVYIIFYLSSAPAQRRRARTTTPHSTDHARHRCDLFRTGNCKLLLFLRSGRRNKPIPDPGSSGQKGTATLVYSDCFFGAKKYRYQSGSFLNQYIYFRIRYLDQMVKFTLPVKGFCGRCLVYPLIHLPGPRKE